MARKGHVQTEEKQDPDGALERMDEALKAALKMPPRKHKDEPKRRIKDSKQTKADRDGC